MLSQACQRCWQRKQKCDRKAPECSSCANSGHKCVLRVWGRPVDIDGNSDELNSIQTSSPIAELRRRIEFLERKQSQATIASPSNANPSQSQASDPDQSATVAASSSHTDGTAGQVGYLSLAAMSGGDAADDQTPGQNSTLEHLIRGVIATQCSPCDTSPHVPSTSSEGEVMPISASSNSESSGNIAILEAELIRTIGLNRQQLVTLFVYTTASSLPFVSQSDCLNALKVATSSSEETMSSNPALSMSLVLASCLLAIVSTTVGHGTNALTLHLVLKARQSLSHALMTVSDIDAVQCLLFQSLIALYHPTAGSIWDLIGLALTRAIACGLHRPAPGADEEIQKQSANIFWSLYAFDRRVASSLGRPAGLEDHDIALDILEIPNQPSAEDVLSISQLQFALKVQQFSMTSEWHDPSIDLGLALEGLEYWRESYHAIAEQLHTLDQQDLSEQCRELLHSTHTKDELQISLRSLALLFVNAWRSFTGNEIQLSQIKEQVNRTMPNLVESLLVNLERSYVTLLDGYDGFTAAIVYILSNFDYATGNFTLGMSKMKTVSMCIDITQLVSSQFRVTRCFKDVIWSLLQALEARVDGDGSDYLARSLATSATALPQHMLSLIKTLAEQ